jgi:hypothetical protein
VRRGGARLGGWWLVCGGVFRGRVGSMVGWEMGCLRYASQL